MVAVIASPTGPNPFARNPKPLSTGPNPFDNPVKELAFFPNESLNFVAPTFNPPILTFIASINLLTLGII